MLNFVSTSPIRSTWLTLLVVAAFGLPVQAQEFVSLERGEGPTTRSTIEEFWTPERLAAAQAVPMPEPWGVESLLDPQLESPGEPGLISGGSAGTLSQVVSIGGLPSPQDKPFLLDDFLDYPPPFDMYRIVFGRNAYPHNTIGVLFFSDGVNLFRCSAAAVTSFCPDTNTAGNRNLIITAGHCVAPGDGVSFYQDWLFVPAYHKGQDPFGSWTWSRVVTHNLWFTSGDLRRDVAMIEVDPGGGADLHSVVGALGFAFNFPRNQHWHALGFPSAPPFDGQVLRTCAANTSHLDSSFGIPQTTAIGCSFTGGSSGGPWLRRYREGFVGSNNNFWNSLTSYVYTAFPNENYGPYSDTTVNNLRENGSECP